MITWLPQFAFGASAKRLDDGRLLKQIEMCREMIPLLESGDDWPEEVRMWVGYEQRFCLYALMMVGEAVTKRWIHPVDSKIFHEYYSDLKDCGIGEARPPWEKDTNIIRSHRSRLISLDAEHYQPLFPRTPERMPVLWPQVLKADPGIYRLRLKTEDIKRLSDGRRVLPPWLYYNPDQNEVLVRSNV